MQRYLLLRVCLSKRLLSHAYQTRNHAFHSHVHESYHQSGLDRRYMLVREPGAQCARFQAFNETRSPLKHHNGVKCGS